jgi:TubC N-terminal docking domain
MGGVVSAAAALLAELRQRRVELEAAGDKLRYRPAEGVTPDDLERLRTHKAELLRLLTTAESAPPTLALDATTVREVLGPAPAPEVVATIRREVIAAIAVVQAGIATGALPPRQIVRGHPLADWLTLDEIARLLRAWRGLASTPRGRRSEIRLA